MFDDLRDENERLYTHTLDGNNYIKKTIKV